jgi:hypothetical protein
MRAPSLIRLASLTLALALARPAFAQATRTWVSGVGDDANPCSRTAPCKTFAGAISRTAAGGEIDALDPGAFGQVTITKSITIDGGRVLAGIDGGSGTGVVVNAGAADVVVLRRLRLTGSASAGAGIAFGSGGALRVDSLDIGGFAVGIDFRPAGGGQLDVSRTDIEATAAGVEVASGDAATPGRATLSEVHLSGGDYGLLVTDHGFATLRESVVAASATAAVAALPTIAGDADVNVQDVVLSGAALGVAAQAAAPGKATLRLSRLTALDATPSAHVGLNGDIQSFGDNRLLTGPDFDLAVDPPAAQVSQGTSAAFNVATTAVGISPPSVALSCEGLPAHARCEFSPAAVSPTGTAVASTLTIHTDGSSAVAPAAAGLVGRGTGGGGRGPGWPLAAALLVVLAALGWRRAGGARPAFATGALALGLVVACNGGGGSSEVAAGTYQVTVKASAGVVTHQTTVSLEVTK